MPFFSHESKRDENDINEIFCLIYSELTSLHQSNEPLRIFFQYLIPLFDIVLGSIVFKKNSINPIVTYPLYNQDNLIDVWSCINSINQNPQWINLTNTCAKNIIQTYSVNKYDIKEEVKSFCIIPISIIGCIKKGNIKETIIGNVVIFSRLPENQFFPEDKFLKIIQNNITASFLQPSERLDLIYKRKHSCIYQPPSEICNEKGFGPLNNSGIFLCDWYEKQ